MPFMKWCPLEWKYGKYENPSKNSYAKNAGFDGWGENSYDLKKILLLVLLHLAMTQD